MTRTDRPWHVVPVTDRGALWCRIVAWTWGGLAVAVMWFLALNDIIPESPGGKSLGGYSEALQLGALAVYATGLLVSWPVPSLGAATMAVGALLLGLLAGVQYESWFTVLLALVLIVPPVLVWLAWQRGQRLRGLTALATVTMLLLATVWYGAAEVKARNFGPAHPQSALRPLRASDLDWIWSGAVTPTSFSVVARVRVEARTAVLVVSTGLFNEPQALRSAPADVDADPDGIVRLAIDGLVPETEYHYAVEVDGTLDTTRVGRVRTLPDGPASFSLAFASCARTGSNGSIFDEIARRDPLVYVEIGDLYYGDVTSNHQGQMVARLSQSLRAAAQAALYRQVPIAYAWDDHDYGGDGADETSKSRPAALAVYRRAVPSYLPAGEEAEAPIAQAFTVGRVRVVLTDGRSQRTPSGERDGPDKHIIGPDQEAWLLQELLDARDDHALVIWASPTPWIGSSGSDTWAAYSDQRARIARFVEANHIDNLVVVTGDAHMLAVDDGTNSGYAGAGSGFPVLNAAALDRPGSTKGGPYSEGMFPGGGHAGLVEITDDGGDVVKVTLRGIDYTGRTVVQHSFAVAVG